jgi:hypothetical protein
MPKPTTRIPLLLRRALTQLRGDPAAGWPNATRIETPESGAPYGSELYGPQWPFPTLKAMMPHLGNRAAQAELRRMIERLEKARIGGAWSKLAKRCAAMNRDPGELVLLALAEALVEFNVTGQADVTKSVKAIRDAACVLAAEIEVLAATGTPLDWLVPADPLALPAIAEAAAMACAMEGNTQPRAAMRYALSRPEVLVALLHDLGERKIGTAAKRKGTKAERRARVIGRHLAKLVDSATACTIAEGATGATITDRSLRPGR